VEEKDTFYFIFFPSSLGFNLIMTLSLALPHELLASWHCQGKHKRNAMDTFRIALGFFGFQSRKHIWYLLQLCLCLISIDIKEKPD